MSGVLKACDTAGRFTAYIIKQLPAQVISLPGSSSFHPPHTHRKFSRLEFARGTAAYTAPVDEKELVPDMPVVDDADYEGRVDPEKAPGGWLESDVIEDW